MKRRKPGCLAERMSHGGDPRFIFCPPTRDARVAADRRRRLTRDRPPDGTLRRTSAPLASARPGWHGAVVGAWRQPTPGKRMVERGKAVASPLLRGRRGQGRLETLLDYALLQRWIGAALASIAALTGRPFSISTADGQQHPACWRDDPRSTSHPVSATNPCKLRVRLTAFGTHQTTP